MKCLLLTDAAAPETSNPSYLRAAIAQLDGMEIRYDRYKVETAPSQATASAAYDFVYCPRIATTAYKTWIDNANLTIPVIVAEMRGTSSNEVPSSTPGVSGSASAVTEQYFTCPFTTSTWLAISSRWWTLTTGVALITAQALDKLTQAAQTYAGQVTAWHTPKAGAGRVYCSSVASDAAPLLAFMLQAAYNAGDFTDAQMNSLRRLPVPVDMDHVIGGGFINSVSVTRRWLDLIPSTGVVWCGVTANADGSMPTVNADVLALLNSESGKRLRFCYHEHSTGRMAATGAWPYAARGGTLADAITKANQETYYADRKTKWEALGMTFHQPGFYVPGGNTWNEHTLQLFSPQTSLASDGANTTSKAGYGFTMVRNTSSNTCSRPSASSYASSKPINSHKLREYMRGMTIMSGHDVALQDSLTTITQWSNKFFYICAAMAYGSSVYFHDEDFVDTQDPATAEFGVELLTQIVHFGNYLNKTAEFFADPTRYSLGPN